MNLENVNTEIVLPSRDNFLGGILVEKKVGWLSVEQRFNVKTEVERIASEAGVHRNEVIDALEINRIAYYDRVDPLTQADDVKPKKEKRPGNRREFGKDSVLTSAQKVDLFDRAERLRLEGAIIPAACAEIGIFPTQYFRWLQSIDVLRVEAKSERESNNGNYQRPIVSNREVVDESDKIKICESVHIIVAATKCRVNDACADFGISYQEFRAWMAEFDVQPIFEIQKGVKVDLSTAELRISTANKVRLIMLLSYIDAHTAYDKATVASNLGYREDTVPQWEKIVRSVSRSADQSEDTTLEPRELQKLAAKAGIERSKLKSWLKAFGLQDSEALLTIPSKNAEEHELVEQVATNGILDTWRAYKSDPENKDAFDRLVEFYLPLVRANAKRYKAKLPQSVTLEDLEEYGNFGLMDAIRLYDMSQGVKFSTYSIRRIVGSMQDGLREKDWIPRSVRTAQSRLKLAREQFSATNPDTRPSVAQLAEILEVPEDVVINMLRLTSRTSVKSLDATMGNSDSDNPQDGYSVIAQEVDTGMSSNDRTEFMKAILTGLSDLEKRVVILYYRENKTMKQIGEEIDLSESRVSQMHTAIIERFRSKMEYSDGRGDILDLVQREYHGSTLVN